MYIELIAPFTALTFSTLLCIIFFSKKRVKLLENYMFQTMITAVLIDSLIVTINKLLVVGKTLPMLNSNTRWFLEISNKLDAFILIIVSSCIFLYILIITVKLKEKTAKIIIWIVMYLNIIAYIIINSLGINFIEQDGIVSVSGSFLLPVYITSGIYLSLSTIITLANYKKLSKRHIPVFSAIMISCILIIAFFANPFITFISISLTFGNFIMFFTIENPDIKVISQLNLAKDQAMKANRAKTDFLSSMSHEIRTPLNAILGLSQILESDEQLPEKYRSDIKDISNASNTLLEIVGNVLDINKIEANKLTINNCIYNIEEEVEKIIDMNKIRIGKKDITINKQVNTNDLLIGDVVHIKSILNNLISNAIKYTNKGNIDIIINTKKIETNKVILEIIVKDTGIGIKEESIGRLFNKFDRLDTQINSTIEGTGLGLSITKSLVELLNGTIEVDSIYQKGTTFIVKFPQQLSDSNIDTNKLILEKKKSRKKKFILIVDDNQLNLKVASRMLEESYKIDMCSSGTECLEKIKKNNYDLILMDIMMPTMSGEETLLKLKENSDFITPVVALTADALYESTDKYIKIGFNDYLAKPFSNKQINDIVSKNI